MQSCCICNKTVSEKCKSILCVCCKSLVHQQKCSNLSRSDFLNLQYTNNGGWFCGNCIANALPFCSKISEQNKERSSSTIGFLNDEHMTSLFTDLNNVAGNCYDDDSDSSELKLHSANCKYYECQDYDKLLSQCKPFYFSCILLNIASMSKHFRVGSSR